MDSHLKNHLLRPIEFIGQILNVPRLNGLNGQPVWSSRALCMFLCFQWWGLEGRQKNQASWSVSQWTLVGLLSPWGGPQAALSWPELGNYAPHFQVSYGCFWPVNCFQQTPRLKQNRFKICDLIHTCWILQYCDIAIICSLVILCQQAAWLANDCYSAAAANFQ